MFKKYYQPTPIFWRKFGDGLLGISTLISVGGIIEPDTLKQIYPDNVSHKIFAAIILCGVVGKFLTNFFAEPQPQEPQKNDEKTQV